MLPIWVAAGLADYLLHRRTHIETTSGITESVTHSLMVAEMGPAVLACLLLEVDSGVIALAIACYLAHEATVALDIFFTASRRVISPLEQQVHGYLRAVPTCLISFLIFTHWDEFLALAGKGPKRARLEIQFKPLPLPLKYIIPFLAGLGALTGTTHIEELWRCWQAGQDGDDRPNPSPDRLMPYNL